MRLSHLIKFVADMDKAVVFHRDTLGLTLKFQSPGWSEFATGETALALHPAAHGRAWNPAGDPARLRRRRGQRQRVGAVAPRP